MSKGGIQAREEDLQGVTLEDLCAVAAAAGWLQDGAGVAVSRAAGQGLPDWPDTRQELEQVVYDLPPNASVPGCADGSWVSLRFKFDAGEHASRASCDWTDPFEEVRAQLVELAPALGQEGWKPPPADPQPS